MADRPLQSERNAALLLSNDEMREADRLTIAGGLIWRRSQTGPAPFEGVGSPIPGGARCSLS